MGSDPAPFIANLFLYYYENKWLLDTKKRDLLKARLFSNATRFIGDLCAINDHLEFNKNFKSKYPSILLRFRRTTSDMNNFITLSNRLLKRMQKIEVNIVP